MPRRYTIVHEPYLIEWLSRNFPRGTWMTNVRLGLPRKELRELAKTPEEQRALKLWTARADAVVILDDKVIIVEALVRPEWWKIEQLVEYEMLFRHTPEFADHWHKPVEKVLLTVAIDDFHKMMAEQRGVRVVVYRPAWIESYLALYPPRHRRGPGALIQPPRPMEGSS